MWQAMRGFGEEPLHDRRVPSLNIQPDSPGRYGGDGGEGGDGGGGEGDGGGDGGSGGGGEVGCDGGGAAGDGSSVARIRKSEGSIRHATEQTEHGDQPEQEDRLRVGENTRTGFQKAGPTRIFSATYFSKRGENACAQQRAPTHPPALLAVCTCMAAVLCTHAHTSSSLKTSTAAYYICLDEHGLHGARTVAHGDRCVLASLP